MRVTGIIAEYNPFHNGHKYHILKSKEITDSDYCVVVMSGNYVQRGEPAMIDKWARTKAALLNGADVVIELPVHYATSSAEFFSLASITLLNNLGVVNSICFGSEVGNIDSLNYIAETLAFEPYEFKILLNNYLKTGISFPKARNKALEDYYHNNKINIPENITKVLNSPNNILGIEYLKALKKLKSNIKPYTIKRIGAGYHDEDSKIPLASASAIRKLLKNNDNLNKLRTMVPPTSYDIIINEITSNLSPIFYSDIFYLLRYKLLISDSSYLSNITDITEGLENRILSSILESTSINELIKRLSTKRFTNTKINRALLHILLDIDKKSFQTFTHNGCSQYVKVLGFNSKSQILMKKIKDNTILPLIVNVKDSEKYLNPLQNKMLKDEIMSTNVYNTIVMNKYKVCPKNDYTQPIIII